MTFQCENNPLICILWFVHFELCRLYMRRVTLLVSRTLYNTYCTYRTHVIHLFSYSLYESACLVLSVNESMYRKRKDPGFCSVWLFTILEFIRPFGWIIYLRHFYVGSVSYNSDANLIPHTTQADDKNVNIISTKYISPIPCLRGLDTKTEKGSV